MLQLAFAVDHLAEPVLGHDRVLWHTICALLEHAPEQIRCKIRSCLRRLPEIHEPERWDGLTAQASIDIFARGSWLHCHHISSSKLLTSLPRGVDLSRGA